MRRVGAEIAAVLVGALEWMRRWRWPLASALVATAIATALLMPHDASLLGRVREAGADWRTQAEWLSRIGRFENSSLAFAALAASIGLLSGSRRWKDVAVACLLAGIVAGLAVNVLRPTFGRARPHADVEAGFYWFEIGADLHSMPSGHAMSNSASAAALIPVIPWLGAPAMVYAAGVGWSRMQLNRHYPTDVLWGTVLGTITGLAVGASIRDRRRSARSTGTGRS